MFYFEASIVNFFSRLWVLFIRHVTWCYCHGPSDETEHGIPQGTILGPIIYIFTWMHFQILVYRRTLVAHLHSHSYSKWHSQAWVEDSNRKFESTIIHSPKQIWSWTKTSKPGFFDDLIFQMHVNTADSIISMIWLLTVIGFLWSCQWAHRWINSSMSWIHVSRPNGLVSNK